MEENLETLATYEPVGWENAEITKEATVTIDGIEYEVTPRIVSGKTPVNATNLSHMDDAIQENREAINDLYNGGATTSEIIIDTKEPPAEKEKIWINPDNIVNNLGSEVVNSLDGNEKDKSPSVYAINNELIPINDSVNEFLNMGLLTAKYAPTMSSVASIDKTKFGIYSIAGGTDTPTTGNGNDNYTIINLPSVHGTNYSIQIAFSIWVGQSAIGGTKIYWKAGSQTAWQSTN